MKPYLSLIIPYYNDEKSIGRLVQSIGMNKVSSAFEVIIVDDASRNLLKIADIYHGVPKNGKKRGKKWIFPIKIIRLEKNKGPAVARNRGAEVAKGKFLVFLDSDVELFSDTLFHIIRIFREDPDAVALTGVWIKKQRTKAFFPTFKALRDWSYWINERDKSGYYFLFSTRIASIKRSVFIRLGGFEEHYPAPLVEDIELTYRIARRYAILFAPHVRVRHEFEPFWPVAKKYFWRSFYWTKLYAKRKKFDPVATTWWEALATLSGVAVGGFGLLSAVLLVSSLRHLGQLAALPALLAVFVHLFLIRRFLMFVYQERGFIFMIQSFFVGLVLYWIIFAGALAAKLDMRHER